MLFTWLHAHPAQSHILPFITLTFHPLLLLLLLFCLLLLLPRNWDGNFSFKSTTKWSSKDPKKAKISRWSRCVRAWKTLMTMSSPRSKCIWMLMRNVRIRGIRPSKWDGPIITPQTNLKANQPTNKQTTNQPTNKGQCWYTSYHHMFVWPTLASIRYVWYDMTAGCQPIDRSHVCTRMD